MHLFLVFPYRFLFGIFQKLEKVTTHHGPDSEIDSTDFKLTYVVMEGHPFCVKCPLSYIKKQNYIRLATVKRAMLLILVLPHRCFFRIFLEIKKKNLLWTDPPKYGSVPTKDMQTLHLPPPSSELVRFL